jgi:hypothetical protein
MGLPVEKDLVPGAQHVERRRESEGTVVPEGRDGEGHAREVPVVKAAKRGKGWLGRITSVAP